MKNLLLIVTVALLAFACSPEKTETSEASETQVTYEVKTIAASVTGMDCHGCVASVKRALEQDNAIASVDVKLDEEMAYISVKDGHDPDFAQISETLSSLGYGFVLVD